MGHSSQNEENEQRVSAQEKKLLQHKNEDARKAADKPDWEAEKTTESRNEVSVSISKPVLAGRYILWL